MARNAGKILDKYWNIKAKSNKRALAAKLPKRRGRPPGRPRQESVDNADDMNDEAEVLHVLFNEE